MGFHFPRQEPLGKAIDDDEFRRRHQLITYLLLGVTPVLLLVGSFGDFPLWQLGVESVPPLVLGIAGRRSRNRTTQSALAALGLAVGAGAATHLSGGSGIAHLSWFVGLSFLALYVDGRPVLIIIAAASAYLMGFSLLNPAVIFGPSQSSPFLATGIQIGLLLLAGLGFSINWKYMNRKADEARLTARAQAHTLRHRAMVAADATGRTGELTASSASARRSMTEADELVNAIGDGTTEVSRLISEVATLAQDADFMSTETNDTIKHLTEQSSSIAELVQVIEGIASRTNLLALNASIEAARAGEAGKGFAVVANEVKELAMTTAKATDKIASITSQVQSRMDEANQAVSEVSETVRSIAELQREVDTAMFDQTEASNRMRQQVNDASNQMIEIIEGINDLNELLEEDAADDPTDAFNAIHRTNAVSLRQLVR